MDVTGWLLRLTLPRAFVVTAVGGTGARLSVERALRVRGWRQALTPAEADLLVVCGPARPGLDEALDRVWDQLPGPRACAEVATGDRCDRALDEARATLLDTARQRRDAAERDLARPEPDDEDMPGGIPMADRAEDRDGLTLDQLHLALGPALPDWPAGLLVRLTIQGDVVQDAGAEIMGGSAASSFWDAPDTGARPGPERFRAARDLDSLQRFLAVAGWAPAAEAGRRLRDALLSEAGPDAAARREARHWVRRVRRSRTLRWSTDGLGRIADAVPGPLLGDATDRWTRRLDRVGAEVGAPGDRPAPEDAPPAETARAALDLLPSLLVGQELAAVRIIAASLDPDTESVGARAPGRPDG